MSNSKKRKTTFNTSYATEFGFIKKDERNDSRAICTLCSTYFSIASGGRSSIVDYSESDRHLKCKLIKKSH